MCGGTYSQWSIPRHLMEINKEPIVFRTVRLLKEQGIDDIAISSNNNVFRHFDVPLLSHKNNFIGYADFGNGYWVEAFYDTGEPTCYLMGDVVFSKQAIKTIVETKTDDIQFFASAPPFAENYCKEYAEPFAFKVVNVEHFRNAIKDTIRLEKMGRFNRRAIAWELWQVIKNTPFNKIDYSNYKVINDYTCDVDEPDDLKRIEPFVLENE